MRIIVEGPDGAGKSTFIKGLMDRHPDFERAPRFATSEDGPMEALRDRVDADLGRKIDEPGRVIIYDRHPLISELIYSPALGRPLAYGFDDLNWLADALVTWRCIPHRVVYCMPPRDHVIKNVFNSHAGTSDHQRGVRRMIAHIYDLYLARVALDEANPQVPVMVRDYTDPATGPKIVAHFQDLEAIMNRWRKQHEPVD